MTLLRKITLLLCGWATSAVAEDVMWCARACVDVNDKTALRAMEDKALAGDSAASRCLAEEYTRKSRAVGMAWWTLASVQGNREASFELGRLQLEEALRTGSPTEPAVAALKHSAVGEAHLLSQLADILSQRVNDLDGSIAAHESAYVLGAPWAGYVAADLLILHQRHQPALKWLLAAQAARPPTSMLIERTAAREAELRARLSTSEQRAAERESEALIRERERSIRRSDGRVTEIAGCGAEKPTNKR